MILISLGVMAKDVNKFKYKVSVVLYIHKCVETAKCCFNKVAIAVMQ